MGMEKQKLLGIEYIYIENMAGLHSFSYDLRKHNDFSILTGQNGLGKSSIFEIVSLLFGIPENVELLNEKIKKLSISKMFVVYSCQGSKFDNVRYINSSLYELSEKEKELEKYNFELRELQINNKDLKTRIEFLQSRKHYIEENEKYQNSISEQHRMQVSKMKILDELERFLIKLDSNEQFILEKRKIIRELDNQINADKIEKMMHKFSDDTSQNILYSSFIVLNDNEKAVRKTTNNKTGNKNIHIGRSAVFTTIDKVFDLINKNQLKIEFSDNPFEIKTTILSASRLLRNEDREAYNGILELISNSIGINYNANGKNEYWTRINSLPAYNNWKKKTPFSKLLNGEYNTFDYEPINKHIHSVTEIESSAIFQLLCWFKEYSKEYQAVNDNKDICQLFSDYIENRSKEIDFLIEHITGEKIPMVFKKYKKYLVNIKRDIKKIERLPSDYINKLVNKYEQSQNYNLSSFMYMLLASVTLSHVMEIFGAFEEITNDTKYKMCISFDDDSYNVFVLKPVFIVEANGAVIKDYKPFELQYLSSGEQCLCSILFEISSAILQTEKPADKTVIMIDEPENSLHIAWQTKIVNSIMKFKEHFDSDAIICLISTHSPSVIEQCMEYAVAPSFGGKNEL